MSKSPFPSAGTAVSLFRAKAVQQRPLLVHNTVLQFYLHCASKNNPTATINNFTNSQRSLIDFGTDTGFNSISKKVLKLV